MKNILLWTFLFLFSSSVYGQRKLNPFYGVGGNGNYSRDNYANLATGIKSPVESRIEIMPSYGLKNQSGLFTRLDIGLQRYRNQFLIASFDSKELSLTPVIHLGYSDTLIKSVIHSFSMFYGRQFIKQTIISNSDNIRNNGIGNLFGCSYSIHHRLNRLVSIQLRFNVFYEKQILKYQTGFKQTEEALVFRPQLFMNYNFIK